MKRHFVAGVAVFVAATALGRASFGANGDDVKKFDAQESAFIREAAQEDVFEQRLGQYAAEHAATDEVKNLGKTMAQDHQDDLKKLEDLSQNHGVGLAGHDGNLTPAQQTIYDRLTATAGAGFDKEYTKLLVTQHTHAVGVYERERDHAVDVSVREYAGGMVDTMKHHLEMAKSAEKTAWAQK